MKFDDLLEHIGEFGPYQKRIFCLVALTSMIAGYQSMSPVFLLEMNKYRCKLPTYSDDSYSVQSPYHAWLVNLTVPTVQSGDGDPSYSQCYLYHVNETSAREYSPSIYGPSALEYNESMYEITARENSSSTYEPLVQEANRTMYKCHEWVYDTSVIQTTGFTEYNMVCENTIYRSHTNMIDFAGALVGALVFGPIGDRLGRKKALISVYLGNTIASIFLSLSVNYPMFAAATFLMGLTSRVMFMLSFSHAMEIVGPHKRTMAGVMTLFFWAAGLFTLSGVAYFIRQWRHLALALGLPTILVISYHWLIPESPRWLITKGRKKEAAKVIQRIAQSNNVYLSESVLKEALNASNNETHVSILKVMKSPATIIKICVIIFNWFCINLVYYGVSLNVNNLSGDIYINFFLYSVMELVAYVLTLLMLNRVGRRYIYCGTMVLGGLVCLLYIIPVLCAIQSSHWVLLGMSMMGKLFVTSAFSSLYIFTSEMFPTVIRQSALGTCTFFEGIGGMVAPYVADLGINVQGPIQSALPFIVFGSLSVTAGSLAFILPETRDRKLPETLHDAVLATIPEPSKTQNSSLMENEQPIL